MRVCIRCKRNRNVKFYTGKRGRICQTCRRKDTSARAHGARILRTYGITQTEYQRLLAFQRGVCAGCGGERKYRLHIDHDHKLEALKGSRASVRGLLCKGCNKLLRDCRDSADRLTRLARYLESPPARGVIK